MRENKTKRSSFEALWEMSVLKSQNLSKAPQWRKTLPPSTKKYFFNSGTANVNTILKEKILLILNIFEAAFLPVA